MVLSGAHETFAPAFSKRFTAFTPQFGDGESVNAVVAVPETPPAGAGIASTIFAGKANGSFTRSIVTPIW